MESVTGPLDGIKILDLTQYAAGPFCTKLLAEFGARVTKVERPPDGDPARQEGPFLHDEPHPERSALFLHLNTNKRSLTLDLKSDEGREIALRLAKDTDVVVENFRPGTLEHLGLGYDELRQGNSKVILTSISDFGQTGPYRDLHGSELVLYAMGGAMHMTGHPEKQPLKLGGNVVQYHAGATAAFATTLALTQAESRGEGQHVDIAIYESAMGSRDRRTTYLSVYSYNGQTARRPEAGRGVGLGVRPCADGYVNVMGGGARFPALCAMIGCPELAQDERFSTPEARRRPEAAEEFEEYYLPWLLSRTKREIAKQAQKHKLLAAPIFTVEDLLQDPHYQQRGAFEEIDHPEAGPQKYPSRPFIMSESPRPPARRAPLLGEHTEEVICGELGYSREDLARLRDNGVV